MTALAPWVVRVSLVAGMAAAVYEVGPPALEAAPTAPINLLRNPGFEVLAPTGVPEGWSAYGRPKIMNDASLGRSGHVAVRASRNGGLTQTVADEPGCLYTFAQFTRAYRYGRHDRARLRINWLDKRGATLAVIYASVHQETYTWFDDFVFAQSE